MGKSRSTVVEVCDDCIEKSGKIVFLNDLRISDLTNATMKEFLKDQETFYCSGGCSLVYIFVRY